MEVVFKYVFVQLPEELFSYSATSFNKLGQEMPSLGPCLSLGMENMPLGMSARLVNGQLFSNRRVPVPYFGEEKNAKVSSHDFVARILPRNFFLTLRDEVCLYLQPYFFFW